MSFKDKIDEMMDFAIMSNLKEKKLDPVNKKALDKDFDDREDKDIDNDGDADSSDEYLHNRRKAIKKAMTKESVELDEEDFDADLLEQISEMDDDAFESFCQFVAEADLQELSPELLKRYRDKAFPQYDKSRKAAHGDSLERAKKQSTRDKHDKVFQKRNKGIGSADKRDNARSAFQKKSPATRNPGAFSLSKKSTSDISKIKGYGRGQSGQVKMVNPNGTVKYVSNAEVKKYTDLGYKREMAKASKTESIKGGLEKGADGYSSYDYHRIAIALAGGRAAYEKMPYGIGQRYRDKAKEISNSEKDRILSRPTPN